MQWRIFHVFINSERFYEIVVVCICNWSIILMATSVMQCQTSASMASCPHCICRLTQYSTSLSAAYLNTTLESHWRNSRASCCLTLKTLDHRCHCLFHYISWSIFCSECYVQSTEGAVSTCGIFVVCFYVNFSCLLCTTLIGPLLLNLLIDCIMLGVTCDSNVIVP